MKKIGLLLMIGLMALSAISVRATPSITLTADISYRVYGQVSGVTDLANYQVWGYIFVPGWGWVTKPYFDTPYVDIASDGTWNFYYNTGGHDYDATYVAVYLLPVGSTAPQMGGGGSADTPPSVPEAVASDYQSVASLPLATPTPIPTPTPSPTPLPTLTPTPTPTPVPTIVIDHNPVYGDAADTLLVCHVTGIRPADYGNYVFAPGIFVGDGWWTKPTYAVPTVPIGNDGSAQIPLVTGGYDQFATAIVVWLIPANVVPPRMDGTSPLLPALPQALAVKKISRGPATKTIHFAGTDWVLKRRDFPYDPGPCYYVDDSGHVWLDDNGYLHLTVGWENGHPVATEIVRQKSDGYGWYIWTTRGRLDKLDPSMVFGNFFWDLYCQDPNLYHREIDVEFSLWNYFNNPAHDDTKGQFVVQNYPLVTNPWGSSRATRFGFTLTDQDCDLTNVIHWEAGKVTFWAYRGRYLDYQPPADKLVKNWSFTDPSVPAPATPATENFRFNFWMFNGAQPTSPSRFEMVVTGFKYSATALPVLAPSALSGYLAPTYIVTTPSTPATAGQTVYYTYRWASDSGKQVTHGPKTDLLDVLNDQEIVVGETWTVSVIPSAGGVDGPTQTAKVKIVNSSSGVLGWVMYR